MPTQAFPFRKFIEGVVRLLDRIEYDDQNWTPDGRLAALAEVYGATARHFADPAQQFVISKQVGQKKLDAVMRTSVQVTVYCWPECSQIVQIAISIYFVYIVILDDSPHAPDEVMGDFAANLLHGRLQEHPFWRLMIPFLEHFLSHYGPFCSMAILRSTFDYFHGCWIETRRFAGIKGSHYFPLFLRRLNGLGGICGGSLFPKDCIDEKKFFGEVTTAIAQIEPMVAFFNDLFSFYKEWDDPRDEISLLTNICHVEGIDVEEAYQRLIADTLSSADRLLAVFEDSPSPQIKSIITKFVQGYCTWHLCDPRFRIHEIYKQTSNSTDDCKFRQYYEHAIKIGSFPEADWAPSGSEFMVNGVNGN